jgi:hypothetical protein
MSEPELTQMPGWRGMFTTNEYPGAYPNGTRVIKVKTEPGDAHPVGARATVLGSMGQATMDEIGYFVEWDAQPRVASR